MSKQVNKYPIPKYLNSKISAEVAKCHQGEGTWLKQCSGLLDLWSSGTLRHKPRLTIAVAA